MVADIPPLFSADDKSQQKVEPEKELDSDSYLVPMKRITDATVTFKEANKESLKASDKDLEGRYGCKLSWNYFYTF